MLDLYAYKSRGSTGLDALQSSDNKLTHAVIDGYPRD